jgi:acetylornithine deacetylase/succinyl-diaminopimelate desuccinylase-like protein
MARMNDPIRFTLLAAALTAGAAGAAGAAIDWRAAEAEYRALLAELIAADTSNPPGNEILAARILQAKLEADGIACELFEPDTGRANLVARLPGRGGKRPLLILGHIDVVGVQRDKWHTDPFQLVEQDGYLYGRGVIDDKGMVAAEAMTLILLKRAGVRLERDVILLAESDEESGGDWGVRWMLDHQRDRIDAEFALNEGGRVMREDGKVRWVGLQNAEKRGANYKLTARGVSGHASMPREDNPLVSLARAVERASDPPFAVRLTPETAVFFPALAESERDAEMRTALAGVVEPGQVEASGAILGRDLMFNAMLRHTVSPTQMNAGFRTNVIPSTATANLNVRMLPGFDPEVMADSLRARIADPRVEVSYNPPSRPEAPSSPFEGPLVEAVRRAAKAHFPGAPVLPLLSTGATDSAQLRDAGIPSYGLLIFPLDTEDIGRMHGDAERMPVSSLGQGLRFLYDVVRETAR